MIKPIPDTDPLKREPPGEMSKVPGNDVGEAGRPGGKPGEQSVPGQPTPRPEPVDPSEDSPEPEPGQGQPIPPELETKLSP